MNKDLLTIRLSLLLFISFLFGCSTDSWEIQAAGYALQQDFVVNRDSALIYQVADSLLDQTRWKNSIHINSRYDPAFVNIYLINGADLRTRLDDQLAPLLSNCNYAGHNILFIDEAYLRSFLSKHKVRENGAAAGLVDDSLCFLYWAIGHELGHLCCGHLHGQFDKGSLDSFVATSSIQNKEELQADSFLVHALLPRPTLRVSMERTLMDILNAEIEQKVGEIQTAGVGILYDYTNQSVVTYARQPTHPEFVVRLARMLELSTKASGETGMENLVAGFIKQLKEVPAK